MGDKNKIPPSASSVHLSESKPPSSPMACLICHSSVGDSAQFYGFILDPATEATHIAGDGLMPLNPRFRLDGLSLSAFCIVNSILYVFEGRDCSDDDSKSIYSFDLSSLLNESSSEMVVIEKAMLDKCTEMECDKCSAHAILTPTAKSSYFPAAPAPAIYLDIDFELFDPDTNQCRPLPQLPGKFEIHGYGFLSDTVFLVRTDHGEYSFDFDSNSGWESMRSSSFEPWGLFVGLGNELYTDNGLIHRRDNEKNLVLDPPGTRFPDSVNLKLMQCDHRSSWFRRSSSICLLDVAEKEYTLCIARVLFVSGKGNEQQTCVIFDAYKCDLAQLDQKTKASFRFMACIPGDLFAFSSSGLFRAN